MQAPGLFDIPDKRGKYGLVHNIGLGGAVVCSLLRRPEFFKEGGEDGRKRCGSSHQGPLVWPSDDLWALVIQARLQPRSRISTYHARRRGEG